MLPHSKRCSAKLPLRAGLICAAKMHEYLISLHSTYEPCPNGCSALQQRGNAVEICNEIMFSFYTGLPYIILSHTSITSLSSKQMVKCPLRVELKHTTWVCQHLMDLHSVYEPHPQQMFGVYNTTMQSNRQRPFSVWNCHMMHTPHVSHLCVKP